MKNKSGAMARSAVGLMLAGLLLAGAVEAGSGQGRAVPVKLDISSQPLGDALNEFAKQAGLQLVLYSRISEGLMAPPIVGNLSPQNALTRLLDKTGLRFEYIDADTVGIFASDQKAEAALPGTREERSAAMGMRVAQAANSPSGAAA